MRPRPNYLKSIENLIFSHNTVSAMQWKKIETNDELIDQIYLVQHLIEDLNHCIVWQWKSDMGHVRAFSEVTIKTNAIREDTNITPNFSNNYQILLGLREFREGLNDLRPNY